MMTVAFIIVYLLGGLMCQEINAAAGETQPYQRIVSVLFWPLLVILGYILPRDK
jgi:hypothetical protein